MPDILRNTPLAAVSGVAVDTETTGLDVRTARIVEIGAVAFGGAARTFQSLIDPGGAIPQASSAIHGITTEMVAGAPGFARVWPEVEAFIGDSLLLGHSFGFDLAIIERECARAGMPAPRPRVWLDTRFLAILLNARLPDFTISTLAAWLDVSMTTSHRAVGDAEATIAVFRAMIPRLRQIGIHTVGEALAACRRLEQMNDDLARAGWTAPAHGALEPQAGAAGERVDTYPYRHRVRELMSAPPLFIADDAPLGRALSDMAERRISSLFVGDPQAAAAAVGILTSGTYCAPSHGVVLPCSMHPSAGSLAGRWSASPKGPTPTARSAGWRG